MALARVVEFEGVSSERMQQMDQEMQGQEQPEGLNAKELVVLHDPEAERSLVEDVISKPFSLEQLSETARRLVRP